MDLPSKRAGKHRLGLRFFDSPQVTAQYKNAPILELFSTILNRKRFHFCFETFHSRLFSRLETRQLSAIEAIFMRDTRDYSEQEGAL